MHIPSSKHAFKWAQFYGTNASDTCNTFACVSLHVRMKSRHYSWLYLCMKSTCRDSSCVQLYFPSFFCYTTRTLYVSCTYIRQVDTCVYLYTYINNVYRSPFCIGQRCEIYIDNLASSLPDAWFKYKKFAH